MSSTRAPLDESCLLVQRREFLKWLGLAAGGAGLSACQQDWLVPARMVELALRGPGIESFQNSICGLCEGGCGVTVRSVDGIPVGIRGNPRHPLNRGGLCPVGQAGLDVLYGPGRLRNPLHRESDGSFGATTWQDAIGEIAARLSAAREAGTPERIAVVSSHPSQILNELALQFGRAMGTPNVARAGLADATPYLLTQGLAESPAFDLGQSDLVLCFGLDLFESGPAPLHAIDAVVGSRSSSTRAASIHVGTRLSPSASKAEIHVPVRPGTHAAFALGVAHVLVREGRVDQRFLSSHCFGYESWTGDDGRAHPGFRQFVLENYYPERAARLCGCEPRAIVRVARRLARASRPVVMFGEELSRCDNATFSGIAVHSLNALLGSFDRPGGVVLPPRIPLRAMPGAPTPRSRSLFAPNGAPFGRDTIEALAEGILDGSHPVDVLILLDGDPIAESPFGNRLREAMGKVACSVVCSTTPNATSEQAKFVLPTSTALEGWHDHTTPPGVPFAVLGIGRPLMEPLFDTRQPGDILLELSAAQGSALADAVPWRGYAEYLQDRLQGLVDSGEGSIISGSFEESWVHFLEERGWRFLEHADIREFWEDLGRESSWWNPVRSRGDWKRLFATPSGHFEFFSQRLLEKFPDWDAPPEILPVAADDVCLPHFQEPRFLGEGDLHLTLFRPITARGRLGVESSMIMEMFGYSANSGWQTWVELAPETAHRQHVHDGDLVRVVSDLGAIEAVVHVHPAAVPEVASVPVGLGRASGNSVARGVGSNPLEIVMASTDPLSGSASEHSTKVSLQLVRRRAHGAPAPLQGGHG